MAKITAADTRSGDIFGDSITISLDSAVVGAPFADPFEISNADAAYVFERHHGGTNSWGQAARLVAADASPSDQFGGSVSTSGDTVVVGASNHNHSDISDAGAAYVLERLEGGIGAWGATATLTAPDAGHNDSFGASVSIDGGTISVGAPEDKHSAHHEPGSVWVFQRDINGPGVWGAALKLVASIPGNEDHLGSSVSVKGGTVVAGVKDADPNGLSRAGATAVFDRPVRLASDGFESGDTSAWSTAVGG